jgi:hypothetical protein
MTVALCFTHPFPGGRLMTALPPVAQRLHVQRLSGAGS